MSTARMPWKTVGFCLFTNLARIHFLEATLQSLTPFSGSEALKGTLWSPFHGPGLTYFSIIEAMAEILSLVPNGTLPSPDQETSTTWLEAG